MATIIDIGSPYFEEGDEERAIPGAININHNAEPGKADSLIWLGQEKLDLANESVDIAFMTMSMYYNKFNIKELVVELKRLLKPWGLLEVVDHSYLIDAEKDDEYTVTPEKWREVFIKPFEDAGFIVTEEIVGRTETEENVPVDLFYRLRKPK